MARRGKLEISISADPSGLKRGLRSAEGDLGHFENRIGRFGKLGAGALAGVGVAAGGALYVGLKKSVQAFAEAEKVAAQTQAVLKSTGGAARVSAKDVDALADSLSRKSGMDDEAIKAGENLLLTFTNIRNEAGKGNDIFSQTTSLMTDMSVALGQDTTKSAIQLGKALNDPVKGVTALTKVGVSFTEQQKEQIKTLEGSGQHLRAQKVIIAELNKEFGGSSKAAGDTFAGSINKAKTALGNLEETIGAQVAPGLKKLTNRFTHTVQDIEKIWSKDSKGFTVDDKIKLSEGAVKKNLAPALREAEDAFAKLDLGTKLSDAFEKAAPKIADAAAKSAPRVAGSFVHAFQEAGPWGKLVTAAFLAKKLGAFSAGGNLAGDLLVSGFRRRVGRSSVFTTVGGTAGEAFGGKAATRAASVLRAFKWAGVGLAIGAAITEAMKPQLDGLAQWLANKLTGTSPEKIASKNLDTSRGLRDAARQGPAGTTSTYYDPHEKKVVTVHGRRPVPSINLNDVVAGRHRAPARPHAPRRTPLGQNAPRAHTSAVAHGARSAPTAHAANAGDTGIVALGHQLQREGYTVGEHPAFGGVAPVHVQGSYHYRGEAIDVNGGPGGEPGSLDALYARLQGRPGIVELLWRVAGHFDHLHVAVVGATNPLSGARTSSTPGTHAASSSAAPARPARLTARLGGTVKAVRPKTLGARLPKGMPDTFYPALTSGQVADLAADPETDPKARNMRLFAVASRINAITAALTSGRAKTPATRQRLLEELRGLYGERDDLLKPIAAPETDATTDAGGEDPNQPLIDATNANTEALNAQRDAQQAIADEMKRQNDIMQGTMAITGREAVRALADIISGQIGGVGYDGRAATAGDGSLARY